MAYIHGVEGLKGEDAMTLEIETVAIADLHEDPANVRMHPPRNLETIKASLLEFGQQKPIVCVSEALA